MIDAHIHLDDSRFDDDREALIKQAQDAGVQKFIVPAVGVNGFEKLKKLSEENKAIIPAYGLHPYFLNQHQKSDIQRLDDWLQTNDCYAVGECGLDYFVKDLEQDLQQYYFDAQIELAKKYNLPLILHARNAVDAVYNSLKNADYFNAMIHSYNGSIEQTKKLLEHGIKFSFGGVLCNPKATKIHELVKFCPSESIMLETDAPDQNLYPDFKLRNLPVNLLKIAQCYAELKGKTLQQVEDETTEVTQTFFQLKSAS